jgi:hypothetical protein
MVFSKKRAGPGVDVMITIFGDFSQFSAKKLAFFLNTSAMITFLSKFAFVSSQKRHFFAKFFGENILKIITLVPDAMLSKNEASGLPYSKAMSGLFR